MKIISYFMFFTLLMISTITSASAQFYIDGGVTLVSSNTFSFDRGKGLDPNIGSISHFSLSYLLNRKKEKNYSTYGFELDVSSFSAISEQNNTKIATDFTKIRLSINSYNTGHVINERPLFDMIFGLGYGIGKPNYSTANFNQSDLAYLVHSVHSKLGLVFNTNRDGRFEISFYTNFDIASSQLNSYDSAFAPISLLQQGITFKVGGNLSNLKKSFKQKKKKS